MKISRQNETILKLEETIEEQQQTIEEQSEMIRIVATNQNLRLGFQGFSVDDFQRAVKTGAISHKTLLSVISRQS